MFVDRMCTELENAGLQYPANFVDTFILKMIINNASAEKSAFENNIPIFQTEKPIIGE